ncbi:MAG: hypothetical protein H6983_26390 [Ectothiorhodospiraceae bacterium]|nr:hypothetical protein [Ectothiorhodospiraceae bacterium]
MHADGKHSHAALEAELADVLTYLLVLAHELGIDMEAAVEAKQAVCVERWGKPERGRRPWVARKASSRRRRRAGSGPLPARPRP